MDPKTENTETDRLTLLTRFLEQNPGDAFARYGLAMEYSRLGQIAPALDRKSVV